MKKYAALLLALMMMLGSAGALEISDEMFDYWNEQMLWMTENTYKRWVGTEDEAITYAWLAETFESMGYSYDDDTLVDIECLSWGDGIQPSVMAVVPAKSDDPQIVTVCAHYDSHSPGARDNASGVAAMLTLANIFSQAEPFDDTELRFIAFTAEETGHQGSIGYCEDMMPDEWRRSLATFNIDIITLDIFEEDRAFSLDTLGMRTEGVDYVNGSPEAPAHNRAALAMLKAMEEVGAFPPEEEEVTWCGPRHLGDSDHQSFHEIGIDAVNVCFRGTTASGGAWPTVMHTPDDLPNDLDYDRTRDALNAVYTAVDGLSRDHGYGM